MVQQLITGSQSIFTTRATGSAIALPAGPDSIAGVFGLPLSIENEVCNMPSITSIARTHPDTSSLCCLALHLLFVILRYLSLKF
jgi:hypothetical protein